MTTIYITDAQGIRHELDGPEGWSVMEIAKRKAIAGIEAECGGACACATCHVHVSPEWEMVLQAPSNAEVEMLEFANDRQPNSRLSCQLIISPVYDGLELTVP